jgi:hypothetical protein
MIFVKGVHVLPMIIGGGIEPWAYELGSVQKKPATFVKDLLWGSWHADRSKSHSTDGIADGKGIGTLAASGRLRK